MKQDWKKEVEKIPPGAWRVTLVHTYGTRIEKVGDNLDEIERMLESASKKMERYIDSY